jgi:hypothetical protein
MSSFFLIYFHLLVLKGVERSRIPKFAFMIELFINCRSEIYFACLLIIFLSLSFLYKDVWYILSFIISSCIVDMLNKNLLYLILFHLIVVQLIYQYGIYGYVKFFQIIKPSKQETAPQTGKVAVFRVEKLICVLFKLGKKCGYFNRKYFIILRIFY